MEKFKRLSISVLLGLFLLIIPTQRIFAISPKTQQGNGHSPADLIKAVNDLRLENGLPALDPHPALMQIAQWEADVILAGAPGHTRPEGLTLGQWMISLGYPLGGNIALDGYRSENWVGGTEMTVEEAIISWLGDAPHTNTMLSPNRSDIGAGVAVGEDDFGYPVYYYVIETALQTSDGQQQYEALVLLTDLPQTQSAVYGDATQAAAALSVPQYIIPVAVGTARPDGDVIHQVKYGQTLWSIAIAYAVKIDQIKRLNNLASNEVWPDQKLLIQKHATLPVPTLVLSTPPTAHAATSLPSPTIRSTLTPTADGAKVASSSNSIPTLTLFIVLVLLVPGSLIWLFLKESKSPRKPPPPPVF